MNNATEACRLYVKRIRVLESENAKLTSELARLRLTAEWPVRLGELLHDVAYRARCFFNRPDEVDRLLVALEAYEDYVARTVQREIGPI